MNKEIKFYLTYTITNQTTKEVYFIQVSKNDSIIKAKNILAKTILPILMNVMKITDSAIIKENKSGMLKSIKKDIYEGGTNTQQGYKSIEVTGNIANVKKEIISIAMNNRETGEIFTKEVEGIKYNSKVLPNLDLYIVKDETCGYSLTEKTSGKTVINMKCKTPSKIEAILIELNVNETTLINAIKKLTNAEIVEVPEVIEIETIEEVVETPQTTPEPLQIPNQPIIFTHANIAIHANIESYTSKFTLQSYNQIKDITISQDNRILLQLYNICFPINPPKKYSIINFDNYAEYICKYIISQQNNNIDFYWTNIKLTELLNNKHTSSFDTTISRMKQTEQQEIKEAQQLVKQNKINSIISELETTCIDKKLLLYKDYSNIIIFKNKEYFDKKDRILPVLKSFMSLSNYNNNIDYDKYFKEFELCNICLNYSNNLELLQDAKKLIS